MRIAEARWKFSVAVLLPVIAAVLVTVALAAGFVLWSAQRIDQSALDRQRTLVTHLVEGARFDFEGSQGTVVLRYEAVEAFLSAVPDMDWIDGEFGGGEYFDFGHNRVYVIDPSRNPIYAALDGESADLAMYEGDRDLVQPLVEQLQGPEFTAGIAAYEDGTADWPPQLSSFVNLDGRIALVSVLPITSNWDGQEQVAGSHYFHVALQYLDDGIEELMMEENLLVGAHFDAGPETLPEEAMVPILNDTGRFVAFFKWHPDRPGQALLNETLPASIGLLAVIGIVIGLLLFGLARSTAALEKAREEALHRATHDPLTGLANRALFNECLERSPLPLALLALDLDRFKQVNDTLGHSAGDELLRQVARRLSAVVGDIGIVARLGGDEFMVLVPSAENAGVLADLAAGLVATIAAPFQLGADTAHIGVSVGIATALHDERNDLVTRADYALYDAKESGRNTYRVFDEIKRAA